jgi:hypothetical protein
MRWLFMFQLNSFRRFAAMSARNTHVRIYLLAQFDLQSAESPLAVIYEGDRIKPEFQVKPGYYEQRNLHSIPPSNPVSRPCTLY